MFPLCTLVFLLCTIGVVHECPAACSRAVVGENGQSLAGYPVCPDLTLFIFPGTYDKPSYGLGATEKFTFIFVICVPWRYVPFNSNNDEKMPPVKISSFIYLPYLLCHNPREKGGPVRVGGHVIYLFESAPSIPRLPLQTSSLSQTYGPQKYETPPSFQLNFSH